MYSPYALIYEAKEKIFQMILDMPKQKEKRVIELLNAAETYPEVSKYQLASVRKMLVDLYISHEIYGSAYDHCLIAMSLNPNIALKGKLKKLILIKNEHPDSFIYSFDPNIVDLELCYTSKNQTSSLRIDDNSNSLRRAENAARMECMIEARESDKIFDPEHEALLEERLSKLDELSRTEFYRRRAKRKSDDVLSQKELDILYLESLERSYNRNMKQ